MLEPVAQPLHDGPGDEDAAFERVLEAIFAAPPCDRRKQVVGGRDRSLAGIEQHEAAGAVRVLREAGREAGLPEQRRLLVAGDAGDRHLHSIQGGVRAHARRRYDAWKHRPRNVEQREQLVVPFARVDVEQQRAARVRRVGDVDAARGQVPDEPAVDRAEGELAAARAIAGARHVVEQPGELGSREIGVQHEARALADLDRMPGRAQGVAAIGGAPILPDDRIGDRPAGGAIPQHGCLALIRDAERGDVGDAKAGGRDRIVQHARLRRPDFRGVVLDPARLRVDLTKFLLGGAARRPGSIEHDRPRAGRALVQGEYVAHRMRVGVRVCRSQPCRAVGCGALRPKITMQGLQRRGIEASL